MIARPVLGLAVIALTTAGAAPAVLAAYDANDATRACRSAIERGYGIDDLYDVSVDEKKAGRDYNVSGTARIKDHSDEPFACRIRDKTVKEASVENYDSDNGGGSGSGLFGGQEAGAAAVMGALATGAAALLGGGAAGADGTATGSGAQSATAGNDTGISWSEAPARGATTSSSTATAGTGTATGAGTTSATNLELREACRQALQTRIGKDGGAAGRILLDAVEVDDRSVQSKGLLIWQGGRRSDLSVTCNWDRSGQLYVADYSVH